MGILKKGLACAGAFAAVSAGEIAYFYGRTMKRQKVNMERTIKMAEPECVLLELQPRTKRSGNAYI